MHLSNSTLDSTFCFHAVDTFTNLILCCITVESKFWEPCISLTPWLSRAIFLPWEKNYDYFPLEFFNFLMFWTNFLFSYMHTCNFSVKVVVFFFQCKGNLSFSFHLALELRWSVAISIILRTACSVNITDNVSTCFFTLKNLSVVAKWQGSIIISRLLYYMFKYCLFDVAKARQKKQVFYGFTQLLLENRWCNLWAKDPPPPPPVWNNWLQNCANFFVCFLSFYFQKTLSLSNNLFRGGRNLKRLWNLTYSTVGAICLYSCWFFDFPSFSLVLMLNSQMSSKLSISCFRKSGQKKVIYHLKVAFCLCFKNESSYVWVIDQVWGQDGWILANFCVCVCVFMDRDGVEVHKQRTRPISSHLNWTSLVNKGVIIWLSGKCFLQDMAGNAEQAR